MFSLVDLLLLFSSLYDSLKSGEAIHATFTEHIRYKLPKNYINDKYTAELKRVVVSYNGKRL